MVRYTLRGHSSTISVDLLRNVPIKGGYIIEKARENTFRAVNRELISMYWEIGKYISEKIKTNGWGKSVVSDFANFVQNHYVGIQGFSASNIWRMRQFYEIYFESEKLAPLVREISWTNNLIIMSRAKSAEAREFYLMLAVKNRYSKRELERQIDSMLFERTMLSDEKNKVFIAAQSITCVSGSVSASFAE